jgi:hypothetical protein
MAVLLVARAAAAHVGHGHPPVAVEAVPCGQPAPVRWPAQVPLTNQARAESGIPQGLGQRHLVLWQRARAHAHLHQTGGPNA